MTKENIMPGEVLSELEKLVQAVREAGMEPHLAQMLGVGELKPSREPGEMLSLCTGIDYLARRDGSGAFSEAAAKAAALKESWMERCWRMAERRIHFVGSLVKAAGLEDWQDFLARYRFFMDGTALCAEGAETFLDRLIPAMCALEKPVKITVPYCVIKRMEDLTEDAVTMELSGAKLGLEQLSRLKDAQLLSVRGDESDTATMSTFISALSRFKPTNSLVLVTQDKVLAEAVRMLNAIGIEGDDILIATLSQDGVARTWGEPEEEFPMELLPAAAETLEEPEVIPAAEVLEEPEVIPTVDALEEPEVIPAAEVPEEPEVRPAADALEELETLPPVDGLEDLEALPAADALEDLEALPAADALEDLEALPAADALEDLEDLPTADALEDLEALPTADALEDLEDLPAADALEELEPAADVQLSGGAGVVMMDADAFCFAAPMAAGLNAHTPEPDFDLDGETDDNDDDDEEELKQYLEISELLQVPDDDDDDFIFLPKADEDDQEDEIVFLDDDDDDFEEDIFILEQVCEAAKDAKPESEPVPVKPEEPEESEDAFFEDEPDPLVRIGSLKELEELEALDTLERSVSQLSYEWEPLE